MRLWGICLLLSLTVVAAGCRRGGPAADTVDDFYGRALEAYRAEDFRAAIDQLDRAYAADPENVGVNTLLGWSHWRLVNLERARFFFQRALDREPGSTDAQTGLALVSLAENNAVAAVPLLEQLARGPAPARDVLDNLARAYIQSGRSLQAAAVYRDMVRRDPADDAATRDLLGLFGYEAYRDDLPLTLSARPRPERFEQWFRTRGDYLQTRVGDAWQDVYLVGANLGPARPGEFPSTVSREFSVYADWLRELAAMNANTVRVYTILPPAFYRALEVHNRTMPTPLWLIQEVWVHDDAQDLYEPAIEQTFASDLRAVIDLLHGQADIPYRQGSHYGIYTADVSRWVIGIGVGREVEPTLAQRTNARHPLETSYKGAFVSLPHGNATEAWFARMCDLAAAYELERYNTLRPLTVVNWPPLDPLDHPAESPELAEMAFHQKRGERFTIDRMRLPDFWNDTDVVSLDVVKFRSEAAFTGGLFALYHVYQHWPDFLLHEPRFAAARDREGSNRYLGYLQELKRVHPNVPLVIGEYGVATSVAPAHLHPDGWHNGGLTEAAQAALLRRFTLNHWTSRSAGSIVFAWKDEWWKKVADQFTADFEVPRERDPLWYNALDPEEAFGLIGYEPAFPVPLLRGRADDWARATRLYAGDGQQPIQGVSAAADYGYLYVRLDVPPGPIDWRQRHYWIALNTLPGRAGSRRLAGAAVHIESGANFVIQLSGPSSARLLLAENYSPNHRVELIPGERRVARRLDFAVGLADTTPFSDFVIEANRPRFARTGRMFPAIEYNRSALPHGTAERGAPTFSDHALWHADPTTGMIELRIPWGLILITDPSSRQAFAGTDPTGVPQSVTTAGVSIAVLAVSAGGAERRVLASWPALAGDRLEPPPVFSWPPWNEVQYRPYFKASYAALTSVFADLRKGPPR